MGSIAQTSRHGAGMVVKNSLPLIFKQEAERKKLGLVVLLKLKAHPQ